MHYIMCIIICVIVLVGILETTQNFYSCFIKPLLQLLKEQQAGSGFSKNDFVANMLQMERGNERKSEQTPASGALGE